MQKKTHILTIRKFFLKYQISYYNYFFLTGKSIIINYPVYIHQPIVIHFDSIQQKKNF